jgi:hypothetical protein
LLHNPRFDTKLEEKIFTKKLGGVALEKQSGCMTALAPKLYIPYDLIDGPDGSFVLHRDEHPRVKGVKLAQNPLHNWDYNSVLSERTVKTGANTNLQLHNGVMSKITIEKNVLTAAHTKMQVSPDFSTCIPLFLKLEEPVSDALAIKLAKEPST